MDQPKKIPQPPHEDAELLRSRAPAEPDFSSKDPWRVLRIQSEIVETIVAHCRAHGWL